MSITIEKYNQTELSGIKLGQQQKYKTPPAQHRESGNRSLMIVGWEEGGGHDSDNGTPIGEGVHHRKPVFKSSSFFFNCTHKSLNLQAHPPIRRSIIAFRSGARARAEIG